MPTHPVFTSNCRSSRVSGACDQSCRASHMRGCLSESSDSKCPLQTPQGTSVVSGGDIGSRGNRGGKKRVELHAPHNQDFQRPGNVPPLLFHVPLDQASPDLPLHPLPTCADQCRRAAGIWTWCKLAIF